MYRVNKNTKFQVWAAVLSEKGEISSSSQHGDTIGCSLSLYCKFEIVCYLAGGNKIAVPTNSS